MQRFNREPFTPQAQFACVKPFVMAGVAYSTGEIVDTAAIETRRLRQMYEARMINAVGQQQAPALLKPPAPPQVPLGSRSTEHRGFGRWFVIELDGTEHGPMSKDEAEARVAA